MHERRLPSLQAGLVGTAFALISAILFGSIRADGQAPLPSGNDPVARLEAQIQQGTVKLDYQDGKGFLPSLLAHLDVNVDSQLLVFSKTSLRADLISPRTPRAVYFNDNVLVAFVQHADLELVALDPARGLVFYTLEAAPTRRPRFLRRDTECVACHGLSGSGNLITQSVFPDRDGNALFLPGTTPPPPDHTTPLEQRWGGWYVTGTHGSQRHMGNAVVLDHDRSAALEEDGTQNLTSLSAKVDVRPYLAPTSDLVALMTFEHQVRMTNLIAEVSRLARRVTQGAAVDEVATARLDESIDEMLRYMLFVDEAPLLEPLQGVSPFTVTFPARGPRDSQGRSLRDFDLQTRLFRYPLSYMIYSASFEAIPDPVKTRLYKRLHAVLTNQDESDTFSRISAADRKAILEILRETKLNLPADWATPSVH